MDTKQELSQKVIDKFVGAAHGDFATVKALLAEHPSLATATASWGETPIEAAAQTARRDIADLLLAAGAPLDICTAAVFGMGDKVASMLEDNPGLSAARGAHGIPLMYYPAVADRPDIADLVLSYGADVNAGEGGTTPLHGAAMFGRSRMAQWLLSHGADPSLPDYEGKTALEVAHEAGNTDVVRILAQHQGS